MAFPLVRSSNSDTETGDDTSQIVTLPATVESGDLLLVILTVDSNPTLTWPDGWTLVPNVSGVTSGSAARMEAAYKTADGTEGGTTITVTSSNAQKSSARCLAISGWSATPEGASVQHSSAPPDPPSLAPSWGAQETLWIATWGKDSGQGTISGFPTNYSENAIAAEGTTGGTQTGSCWRQLNAATEDPGAWSTNVTSGRSATIAIKGGGGHVQAVSVG